MEKQKPDIVSTVFILIKVSFLHVGFGLFLSVIPLTALFISAPDSFPLGFWSGGLCGSPAAYLYLRLAGADKTLTALQSCLIGALLCVITQLIGFWAWFALAGYGVDAYGTSFFMGLALAACLPFYAYSIITSFST